MEKTQICFDYCIPYSKDRNILTVLCEKLYQLGYYTVAIEQLCNYTLLEKNSRTDSGKKVENITFPEPADLNWLKDEFKSKLRILQRLTIIYHNTHTVGSMVNCRNLPKFDILAAQPMTSEALLHACETFDGDLISFNLEEESPKLFRKYYASAIERNIFFEIKYAPMFYSEACRRNTIKLAYIFSSYNKKKLKFVISSGALDPFNLRSPTDVMYMANIFGLSEDDGKNTIQRTGQELFIESATRRIGKTPMYPSIEGSFNLPILDPKAEEIKVDDEVKKISFLGRNKKRKIGKCKGIQSELN